MNDQLIVLVCIAGAGAVVLMGYAVHFFMYQNGSANATGQKLPGDDNFSQVQYMREVRLRNQEDIAALTGQTKRWREMTGEV